MTHTERPPFIGEPYTHPAGQLAITIRAACWSVCTAFAGAVATFVMLMAGWPGAFVPAGVTVLALLWALVTVLDLAPGLRAVEDEPAADPQRGERDRG